MKVISTWEDVFYQSKNTLYQLPNGVKLLHVVKPNSLEFELGVTIKGGAFFEEQFKLPKGTAHLLEHMLCNPNKVLTTDQEIESFSFGSPDKARFFPNAYTGFFVMCFEAYGNIEALERALQFTYYRLDYPLEKFKDFLEKEKSIVKAEMQGYKKDELNPSVQYIKFVLKNKYKSLQRKVIGDDKGLDKVEIKHLLKLWNAMFTPDNVVISVQCPNDIPESAIKTINDIANLCYSNNNQITIKSEKLDNKLEFSFFQDKQLENGLVLDFSFFEPDFVGAKLTPEEIKRLRLKNFTGAAIRHFAFMELRKKKGLIYSLDTFNDGIAFEWSNVGLAVKCDRDKLSELLVELHSMLEVGLPEFLASDDSKPWLADIISSYVYPLNTPYNHDYAKTKASSVIYNAGYINNTQLSMDISKEITTEELLEYYNKIYPTVKWRVWASSPFEEKGIKKEILESKFFRKG